MAVYDDADRKFLDGVRRFDWMITHVGSDAEPPRWAYTVGLTHSFGHPELVVAGLRPDLMKSVLNIVGARVRTGERLDLGDRLDGALDGFDVEIRAVHPAWSVPLFGYARWFQRRPEPDVLHIVWPDLDGRWPEDPSFEPAHRTKQADLSVAPHLMAPGPWQAWAASCGWPADDDGSTSVVVTRAVLHGEAPVVSVARDDEGSWWFLHEEGDIEDAEPLSSVRISRVLGADPSLVELVDLPRGHAATRRVPGDAWVRQAISPAARRPRSGRSVR